MPSPCTPLRSPKRSLVTGYWSTSYCHCTNLLTHSLIPLKWVKTPSCFRFSCFRGLIVFDDHTLKRKLIRNFLRSMVSNTKSKPKLHMATSETKQFNLKSFPPISTFFTGLV